MKYLIILAALTFIGCKEKSLVQKEFESEVKSEYRINCINVGSLMRCTNSEVVCYYNAYIESMALQCKFREMKKVKQKTRQKTKPVVRYI